LIFNRIGRLKRLADFFVYSFRILGKFLQCIDVQENKQTQEMVMKNEMTNEMTVALAKVIKDAAAKDASGKLVAGEYPVDFTVRVKGSLKKGENYESEIVAKADPWLLLAAALSMLNGVSMDALVVRAELAKEELVDSLKLKAAEAIQKIKATTKTPCAGKVTTKLAVELL